MAEHNKVNVNNTMLSANIVRVKEEQCQEDNFTEHKICIAETVIPVHNPDLQDPIWLGKIKQCEESTCLDNKTEEWSSFEVTQRQNDNVKVEGISADEVKIQINNGLLYCDDCERYYVDYCIECGMLVHILNKHAFKNADSKTPDDIPNDILEIQDCFGHIGIYALRTIPVGVKFGPFTGLSAKEFPWEINEEKFVLDKNKSIYLNWMQYVHPTRNISEGNLHLFKSEDNIYYQNTRQIQAGDELLVYFGEEYGSNPNKIIREDFVTTTEDIVKDIFACTFCCLGFSSKSHLLKHKTVCVKDAAGKFSIEDLKQCLYCKIHLDSKEYFEHHMAFCCARNARKGIPSTPPAKQASRALNGQKRCPRQTYKCEQCKYRTKYQVELKEHNKQHYGVKMYKCGICNRRFKTKKSLRLHVENKHAYVGGKDDQEHSTKGYRNTHIKIEQSGSQDRKKIFKCSMCVFRTKYKQYIRIHIKTIHLKKFDFKCDSCEYRTNYKHHLEGHIRTKHLRKFDMKCDMCEFKTNKKANFEKHIITKHLTEFYYKCDSCEFRSRNKSSLEIHIKTNHLKKFDFKCDSCEFGTNRKQQLKRHIKTKHLKEFDYKCDSCEYRTNYKYHFEVHIKDKHLKKFDLKCDKCEFSTNMRIDLTRHIKTKHLKEFDFKCGSCEFRTNIKYDFKKHIKGIHLKKFDYKCDKCEFGTNYKQHLKRHIKSKHLKEYDIRCEKCEFGTNSTTDFKRHIKAKHLNEFDYKCDSCEYETSRKDNLEEHIKTKHLRKFNYKCDSCEYRTNRKDSLEMHTKRKHL